MPGVVFLIVVPTANFEQEILNGNESILKNLLIISKTFHNQIMNFCFVLFSGFGVSSELPPAIASKFQKHPIGGNDNNLNINLPEHNAVLHLEVELRDKNARRRPNYRPKGFATDRNRNIDPAVKAASKQILPTTPNLNNYFVPMEKVSFVFFSPSFSFCLCVVIFSSSIHFIQFCYAAFTLYFQRNTQSFFVFTFLHFFSIHQYSIRSSSQ